MRFFFKGEGVALAELELSKITIGAGALIPSKGSRVYLDELPALKYITGNEDDPVNNFDYFIVREISYDYGEKITLIDISVEGGFEYYD